MREAAAIYSYVCFSLALLCVAQQLSLALIGIVMRFHLRKIPTSVPKTRFLILVPAHNEEAGLLPTIASLLAMDYPLSLHCIMVIVDNCTDNTSAVALQAGVGVLVRDDADLRGKGHALTWALAQPLIQRYDAVVIIDADTRAEASLLARLNDALQSIEGVNQPAAYQVRYEFSGDGCKEPWLQSFSVAAKASENSFIYRPREALGLANLLQGNGFCVPTSLLLRVPWRASSIVEDAEYAIDLYLAGARCRYIDDVRVVSRLSKNKLDSAPQKVRWSKGMMLLVWRCVPRLFSYAVRLRRFSLAETAIMLLLNSRLGTIYFLLAGALPAFFTWPPHRSRLAAIAAATLLGQVLYGVLVLCASSDEAGSLKNLWLLPRYITHLAAAHLRSLASLKSKEWTRTVR